MTSSPYELTVRNGTVFVGSSELVRCDIGVVNGTITALGAKLSPGVVDLDATDRIVAPGIVDPHVHFGNTMPFADEMASDTASALAGGITTIGCFLRTMERYSTELPGVVEAIETRSYVDVIAHLQIFTDDQIDEIVAYGRDFGVTSFKFYLSGIPGIVPFVDEATLLRGMREAAKLGESAIVAVHCENNALVEAARRELVEHHVDAQASGEGALGVWEHAHPALAEIVAVETAAAIAAEAGVGLYVVHVSSATTLEHIRRLQRAGERVVAETTSAYLALDTSDENGLLAKMVPPVRSPDNRASLWRGVADGTIQTLGTDNTARTRASKAPEEGVVGARPGYPMLATHLPAILHFGYHERGIPLEVLLRAMTRGPSEVFGVFPKKGEIRLGADADLVLLALDLERLVDPKELGSFSDFSPLETKRLRGWPIATVKDGRLVVDRGRLLGPPSGHYLPRTVPALS